MNPLPGISIEEFAEAIGAELIGLKINKLIATQQKLRYVKAIPQMVQFVKDGGRWSKESLEEYAKKEGIRPSPLIKLAEFEDGAIYIHDGHHRICSTKLAGRHMLHPEEYQITKWTYKDWLDINLDVGWYTPYDPRTHCRKPDIGDFKKMIRELAKESRDKAIEAIRNNFSVYAEERYTDNVCDWSCVC